MTIQPKKVTLKKMLSTQDIRSAWLDEPLREEPITVDLAKLKDAKLIIRELPGDVGLDLLTECTDSSTTPPTVNQKKLLSSLVIDTIRNADDPDKALIFSVADRDMLLKTGMGRIMTAANASAKLSGLDDKAQENAKNASIPGTTVTAQVNAPSTTLPLASTASTQTV